jgi:hypothetical protein
MTKTLVLVVNCGHGDPEWVEQNGAKVELSKRDVERLQEIEELLRRWRDEEGVYGKVELSDRNTSRVRWFDEGTELTQQTEGVPVLHQVRIAMARAPHPAFVCFESNNTDIRRTTLPIDLPDLLKSIGEESK